jgi:hydroxymethylpyrimidine pyrophosphatase-like HAD family hydrolase
MPANQFLLCTDLDGTVLGDPEGEARFREWAGRLRGRVILAYVTGRNIGSVRALIAEGRLPEADFASTDVGTSLFDLRDPQNRLARHYLSLADPQWPAQRIRDAGAGVSTPLQGPEGQGTFKASFHWDGADESLMGFKARLGWLFDQRLIVTAGQYLDVLPMCFGKGQAVRFLAAAAGVDLKRTVVAGDMENDLDMFQIGAQGIVPANALPGLTKALEGNDAYRSAAREAHALLDGLQRLGLG